MTYWLLSGWRGALRGRGRGRCGDRLGLGRGRRDGGEPVRLTVRACDPLGAEARAQVVVEVTSLNELSIALSGSITLPTVSPPSSPIQREVASISQNSHLAVSVSHT